MPKTKAFLNLLESVEETYLGKKVKKPYIKKYGKKYDKSEMESVAIAIAKSRGIKTDIKFKRRKK